jgi:ABC-type uncharacterized transport system ATPase subunit
VNFLEARRVTKRFDSVVANDQVSLSVREGEIHAVIGENGAGKSTLMKILYGMYSPDEGELFVRGKKVSFDSPLDALAAGIGMVHQHFMLIERMSVLENFILGAEPTHFGIVDEPSARAELKKLMAEAHTELKSSAEVRALSVGQQQRLEILKLLYRKSDCLIFDEPTGVLTPQEVDQFLQSLRELKARGKTILLITHKLNEVIAVADTITVMRAGKSVATVAASNTSTTELARLLVGRDVRAFDERKAGQRKAPSSTPALKIENLAAERLKSISFQIFPGEILGIAGIEGNGQKELVEAISGTLPAEHGEIKLLEKNLSHLSVEKRKAAGLACIPEDRQRDGLILDFDLVENFYLGSKVHFENKVLVPTSEVQAEVQKAIQLFEIKASGPRAKARSLSGGNQQKVIVARELFGNPKMLIAAQPTRGVDIGAIERIHDELLRRRDEGMAILLVSSELDELLSLSDRILVMREGEISAEFKDMNEDRTRLRYQIGEAMICHPA